NNDVLAMWGLYGTVYTAIGVAHAMQGPRRKWRPRIVLLAVALGFTAAAHLLAAIIGLVAAFVLMLYLAERRRGYVTQILLISLMGGMAILFAFFAFRPTAFAYVFTGGAARFWFSLNGLRTFFESYAHAPVAIALVVAMILYLGVRRCRYFGNTAPFLLVLAMFPLMTTQVASSPWLWSLPFLFTFLGGVFADAIETRYARMFLILMGCILATQAAVSISLLPVAASAR
ncbi:MAG: hypothetical protein FWD64_05830, partial [Acidobacteriaceae bacterium]|nr:hypothetical protein [Acidobacteriaceae bacterium]